MEEGSHLDAIEEEKSDTYYEQPTPSRPKGKNPNFQVIIRVRPPLPREVHRDAPFRSIVHIDKGRQNVSAMEYMGAEVNEAYR